MHIRQSVVAASLLVLAAGQAVAQDKTYDFEAFTRVSVDDGVTATISLGPEFEVTGKARKGEIERLVIEQEGDQLLISGGRADDFVVIIRLPELLALEATSGSVVEISNAGGSDLTIGSHSGAMIEVAGTCGALDAEAHAGAVISAAGLKCETANLEATSGAVVRATASDTAEVEASSGGGITLHGAAEVTDSQISSGGSLLRD